MEDNLYIINDVVIAVYNDLAKSFTEKDAKDYYDLVWRKGRIPEPFILKKIEVTDYCVDYFIEIPNLNENELPKEWYIMRLGKDEHIFDNTPARIVSALLRKEKKDVEGCFLHLSTKKQLIVIDWILQRIRPAEPRKPQSFSYQLQQSLIDDTGLLLTKEEFTEAMAFCGYLPYAKTSYFRIAKKLESYNRPDNIVVEEIYKALLGKVLGNFSKDSLITLELMQKENAELQRANKELKKEVQRVRSELERESKKHISRIESIRTQKTSPKPPCIPIKEKKTLIVTSSKQYVYIFEMNNRTIKIGISKDCKQRAKNVSTGSGLKILRICHTSEKLINARFLEEKMHKIFEDERTIGEFFYTKFEIAREALQKETPVVDTNPI